MIFKKMLKNLLIINFIVTLILLPSSVLAKNNDFYSWVIDFKKKAIQSGVSTNVVNDVMSQAIYLPKVIEYDRYQPEFYEDTFTYIKKRTNKNKVKKDYHFTKKNKKLLMLLKISF